MNEFIQKSKMVICYGAIGNQTTNRPVKVPAVQGEDNLNNFCIQASK